MSVTPLDHETLGKKARRGIAFLGLRTALLQLTVLGGTVVLARVLEPAHFGIFAIVQFAMSFFAFFGDAGLGGALIQRKEDPTRREVASVFSFQLVLVSVLVALVFGFSFVIRDVWRTLPEASEWLLRVLSLQLLLTALRVPPSILMERQLEYGRLATLEVVHTVAYYVVAVSLALLGLGVWALVGSVLAQGVVGVIVAHALHPWKPSLAFDRVLLGPMLRFGIPYQFKNFIAFINGAIAPIYAGAKLGQTSLGLINWAQNTAYFPLKLVEILQRVTFPLYSRMHGEPGLVRATLGRSIYLSASGTYFAVALYFGMGEQIVRVVFTPKWLPALPYLQIFAGAMTIGFLSPLVASALDATGRPGVIARLSAFWTGLNWIAVPLATWRYGTLGFVAGYCVHVVVGNLVVVYLLERLIPGVRLLRQVSPPAVAGVLVYALTGGFLSEFATAWWSLGASVVVAFGAFVLVLVVLDKPGFVDALQVVPSEPRVNA